MPPLRVLVVFGTRPEAIKLCILIRHLRSLPGRFGVTVCVTAQHRSMLDQVLRAFEIEPDQDLDLMRPGQSLDDVTSRVLTGMGRVLADARPDIVVVQGDTTTTFAAALAAFYQRIPVAHVEAGLRTNDRYSPFPEELNRRLTSRLSDLHFAATKQAAENLWSEGTPREAVFVTGNTVIDSLLFMKSALEQGRIQAPAWSFVDPGRKLILVTAHRRESFGDGIESICEALTALARRDDIQLVYPVHRNPNVMDPVYSKLSGLARVELIEPLDYVPLIDLMMRSHFILTDSGGIQEEAPSLGKPVLVMRENTERPEAIEAGTARLVGAGTEKIVAECERLLDDPSHYETMARPHNPFGDGHACERISDVLLNHAIGRAAGAHSGADAAHQGPR